MKKLIIFLGASVIVFASGSCSKSLVDEAPSSEIKLDLKSEQIVNADNAFGLDIFKKVNEGLKADKNLMISPLSISLALAMAYNGAGGETKMQMETMLHKAGLTPDEINGSYKTLVEALKSHDAKVELAIANAIFYDQNFTVKPGFISTNKNYYAAEVDDLDFSKTTATLDRINGWVKTNTRGKIENILDKISPDEVMFLVNAIYFNGKWTYQFDKKKTQNRTFYKENGGEVQVPTMMLEKMTLPFAASEKFSMLELPYGSKKYSMLILLPNNNYTTNDVVEGLDQDVFKNWLDKLQEKSLKVYLPKFEFAYEKSLVECLKALGMVDAFSPFASDFSGISDRSDLFISEVKHKSFIKADEEGTEAAAVTSIGFELTSYQPDPVFDVNRPFVFAIREKDTNALLFLGKVNDPLSYE